MCICCVCQNLLSLAIWSNYKCRVNSIMHFYLFPFISNHLIFVDWLLNKSLSSQYTWVIKTIKFMFLNTSSLFFHWLHHGTSRTNYLYLHFPSLTLPSDTRKNNNANLEGIPKQNSNSTRKINPAHHWNQVGFIAKYLKTHKNVDTLISKTKSNHAKASALLYITTSQFLSVCVVLH